MDLIKDVDDYKRILKKLKQEMPDFDMSRFPECTCQPVIVDVSISEEKLMVNENRWRCVII